LIQGDFALPEAGQLLPVVCLSPILQRGFCSVFAGRAGDHLKRYLERVEWEER